MIGTTSWEKQEGEELRRDSVGLKRGAAWQEGQIQWDRKDGYRVAGRTDLGRMDTGRMNSVAGGRDSLWEVVTSVVSRGLCSLMQRTQ